jgi:hypothetical protein
MSFRNERKIKTFQSYKRRKKLSLVDQCYKEKMPKYVLQAEGK